MLNRSGLTERTRSIRRLVLDYETRRVRGHNHAALLLLLYEAEAQLNNLIALEGGTSDEAGTSDQAATQTP